MGNSLIIIQFARLDDICIPLDTLHVVSSNIFLESNNVQYILLLKYP